MAVDAGSIYSSIQIRLDKLEGELRQAEAKLDQFGKENTAAATKVEKDWTKSFQGMSLAGLAAFAAVGIAIKKAVALSADFEQSIANVRSVASATPEEFLRIQQAAKDAGETTRFTASQAADALYSLASSGMDAAESVAALNGVLLLAGSTQSNLAETSAMLVSTLRQYKLEASDTEKVSNVFASAISKSMANMEKLTLSMRYAGPVASGLNMKLEETVAMLMALYNAGLQGEQAGTGVRSILSALASESDPVVQKLMSLGMSFDQLNPMANSFADILDNINAAGLETGDILSAVGRELGPQMLAFLAAGGDALRDYESKVTDTTAASLMYAQQNDTLAGSLDRLKSVAEAAQINLVEEFTPALRAVVDVLINLISFMDAMPAPMKTLMTLFVGTIPLVYGAAKAYTALAAATAAASGPIGWTIAGIAAVGTAFVSLKAASDKADLKRMNSEFGELAKTLSITVQEADKLSKMDLDVAAAVEVKNDIKLPDDEFKELNQTIASAAQWGSSFILILDDLVATYGTTREQMLRLILANKNLNAEQRRSLEIEHSLEIARADRIAVTTNRAQAEVDALAQAEKEKQDLVDISLAKQEEARTAVKNAQVQRDAELKDAQELLQLGLIDEEEATKLSIKAWEGYVEALRKVDSKQVSYSGSLSVAINQILNLRNAVTSAAKAKEEADRKEQERLAALDEAYRERQAANDDANATAAEYSDMLDEIGLSTEQLLALERQRAIQRVKESEAFPVDKANAIKAIDAYYDALSDDAAAKKAEQNIKDFVDNSIASLMSLASAMPALFSAIADARISSLDREMQAELEAKGLSEESTIERLETELAATQTENDVATDAIQARIEAARAAGDEQTAIMLEGKKLALEAEQKQTEDKLAQEIEREKITAEYEKKKAQIRYNAELWSWRVTLAQSIADAAAAVISGYKTQPFFPAGLAAGSLALGLSGAQVAAITASKPQAPGLETGGIVLPQAGGRTVRLAENGYAELALNAGPSGAAMMGMFAEQIAMRISGTRQPVIIQAVLKGQVISEMVVEDINDGRVRLKR